MTGIPKKVRDALRERANGCCELCGAPANNAHHRRNKSQGGANVLSNLMLLCGSGTTGCHGWVTSHPEWAVVNGYTIHGTQAVPAAVGVNLNHGWVLLTDTGGVVEIPAPAEGMVS